MEKENKEKSKVKYSRIFYYFWKETKGHRNLLFWSFLTITAAGVLGSVIQPVIYQRIIDIISGNNFDYQALKHNFLLLVIFLILGTAFGRATERLYFNFKNIILKRFSDFSFSRLIVHSRSFFADNATGGIISKSSRANSSFVNIWDIILFNFFSPLVVFTGVLVVLFKKNFVIGAVFLVWIIVFIVTSFVFAKKKIHLDEERAKESSKTSERFSDVISNILSVKVFARTDYELEKYLEQTSVERKKRLISWTATLNQNTFQSIAATILEIIGMYITIHLWQKGLVSTGFFVLVQTYMFKIFDFIWGIGRSIRSFASSLSDAKEIIEIFETEPGIKDPEKPEKCKIKDGNILFDNISFEYKDGKDVFKKFKLEIPAGQKVGFVGHSGSGKTTITNLLLRFEDVQSGAIKIDGQDIRNITQDDLRRNISYVPQEPALFHRSLMENIMYGNPKASKLKIIEASKKAHADEFIKEFKDGYDTLVGERGVKLSGGQRQRVAIARVMLEDAPILILDEATSSLDSISENLIQKAFDEVMKDRTTLVIAHRLSTVQKMDRIIVLEKGKIVEDGGHEELLAKGGYYFKLWQAQKDGVI